MKNRTHRIMGAAAALAVVQPHTLLGCALAATAGAMGGAVSDIDLLWQQSARAVLRRTLEAGLLLAGLVLLELFAQAGVGAILLALIGPGWRPGLAMLAGLLVLGFFSEHRSFTHSLLGMALFSAALHLIAPEQAGAFMAGFASHLVLDLLNRAPLRLLFPLRAGCTLRLVAADGLADMLLWIAGWLAVAGLTLLLVLT